MLWGVQGKSLVLKLCMCISLYREEGKGDGSEHTHGCPQISRTPHLRDQTPDLYRYQVHTWYTYMQALIYEEYFFNF